MSELLKDAILVALSGVFLYLIQYFLVIRRKERRGNSVEKIEAETLQIDAKKAHESLLLTKSESLFDRMDKRLHELEDDVKDLQKQLKESDEMKAKLIAHTHLVETYFEVYIKPIIEGDDIDLPPYPVFEND